MQVVSAGWRPFSAPWASIFSNSAIRSLSMSVAPSVNFCLPPPAGIVWDYLNCNSNGRGVQEVPGRGAAQGVRCHRQGTPVTATTFP